MWKFAYVELVRLFEEVHNECLRVAVSNGIGRLIIHIALQREHIATS